MFFLPRRLFSTQYYICIMTSTTIYKRLKIAYRASIIVSTNTIYKLCIRFYILVLMSIEFYLVVINITQVYLITTITTYQILSVVLYYLSQIYSYATTVFRLETPLNISNIYLSWYFGVVWCYWDKYWYWGEKWLYRSCFKAF